MTSLENAQHDEQAIDELVARGLSALPDIAAARAAAEALGSFKSDRAVFAHCLLTLELALAGDEQAREELPNHGGVLLEAWRDSGLAKLLTAGIPALATRWEKVRPIVGEFVEQQKAPPRRPTPGPIPRLATPVELIVEIQEILEVESAPSPQGPQDEAIEAPAELIEEIHEVLEEEPAEAGPRPPPPPPPPAQTAPSRPPPPPSPPRSSEPRIDEETSRFWRFAEEALGRVPSGDGRGLGRSFPADKPADRARLVRFAHSTLARFPRSEHARALASLALLYTAGQEKERGLLGVNRERLETLRTGLSLLGDPGPAASAAVLFENDGPDTLARFGEVVELMTGFLGYCARHGLDPRLPETQARFCSPTRAD